MAEQKTEMGFTVIEMIVALVVMGLFLTMFFQMFLAAESQRLAVIRRAAANDMAISNLRKISTKSQVNIGSTTCTTDAGSQNNPLANPSLPANAHGSPIMLNTVGSGTAPEREDTAGTPLPSSTTQALAVLYTRGCGSNAPAKITSTITFGTETVVHAAYVN